MKDFKKFVESTDESHCKTYYQVSKNQKLKQFNDFVSGV
jgi:hypothetical protein